MSFDAKMIAGKRGGRGFESHPRQSVTFMEKLHYVNVENDKIFLLYHQGKINKPLLVFVHGYASNHFATYNFFFTKAVRYFQRNGYSTVRFDFRGCGNSTGMFEEQTISNWRKDLVKVLEFCKKNLKFSKIVGIGHSLGFFILMTLHKHFHALISLMGKVSNLDYYLSGMDNEVIRKEGKLDVWFAKDFPITKKFWEDDKKYKPSKIIKEIKVPVLLIYSKQDKIVKYTEGEKFKKLNKKAKLAIIKDLDHDFEGKVKLKVLREMESFLKNVG